MDFLQALLATLTPVLITIAGLFAARIEMRIKAVTHAEMEAYHREAMHMAIATGIKIGVGRLTKNGGMVDDNIDDLKAQAVAYARRSVPDAIAYLSASFEALLDIAESKIGDAAPFYIEDGTTLTWPGVDPQMPLSI